MTAVPFIKWVGGKGRLLGQLEPLLPTRVTTWVEPFLGGGGTLFGLGLGRAETCFGADINYPLVNAFRAVRDRLDDLIAELEGMRRLGHYSTVYYQLREEFNSTPQSMLSHGPHADVRLAALFIYLNKTGFNGLYRVNQQGELNVSCGNYTEPRVFDADEMRAASAALQGVGLACVPWQRMLAKCTPDDFVYLDPPYVPVTPDFKYSQDGFTAEDHEALAMALRELSDCGARFMLSQSDTPGARDIYRDNRGWNTTVLTVSRSISSKASTRGDVTELVVRNYTQ